MNPKTSSCAGRAATENRLESDSRIRFLILALAGGCAYGLSLLTPAASGPATWIAPVFSCLVLPLILSVILPEAIQRNRLLALFYLTWIGNFTFTLLLLEIAPRFSFGAGSYLIPPAMAALVLTTLVGARAGILLVVLLGMSELFLLRPDDRYLIATLTLSLIHI